MTKNKPVSLFLTFVVLAVLTILAAAALSGCRLDRPSYAAQLDPTNTPRAVVLTIDPAKAGTGLVFLPQDPTATPGGPLFPTATPNGEGTANQPGSGSSNVSGPAGKAPLLNIPDDQVNILLLGSDQRPYEGGYRTDVIMVVSVNLDSKTINLISFPRDLYVTLPGLYNDRINAAQFRGGFSLLAETFEYNFGFRPDYYGMIHLNGFAGLIDALGGVDVQVARNHTDERTGYGNYTVYAGTVHMDGETALWYVRSRKTTSDFDRTRRQQEVVNAIVRRLVSLDAAVKFPSLYSQFQSTIETNLPLSEITPLLPLAGDFLSGNFGSYAVGPSHVTPWVTPGGAQVLLPNRSAIQAMLKTALNAGP
jgi:polyisoprenyl-teichoic acid--peptidoglycan teichoic acid transferase